MPRPPSTGLPLFTIDTNDARYPCLPCLLACLTGARRQITPPLPPPFPNPPSNPPARDLRQWRSAAALVTAIDAEALVCYGGSRGHVIDMPRVRNILVWEGGMRCGMTPRPHATLPLTNHLTPSPAPPPSLRNYAADTRSRTTDNFCHHLSA